MGRHFGGCGFNFDALSWQVCLNMDSGQSMKPRLYAEVGNDKVLRLIIACISDIECAEDISNLRGKPQSKQGEDIKKFQKNVRDKLEEKIPTIKWRTEYRPAKKNLDSVDVYGAGKGYVVAIELDKARADQVSKKFVSRMAILKSKTYYISLCYPGTEKMNKKECEKYFRYCSVLAKRMKSHYAGLIIESATDLAA